MQKGQKLLLFDIDGTLIDSGGVGLKALIDGIGAAFPEHADQPDPALDLAGATDLKVVDFLFSHYGIPILQSNREAYFAAYLPALEQGMARSERARVLPGVERLLPQLAEHHVLGLLTGNIRAGAFAKLRSFQLDRFFTFGAFGDDAHDRNDFGPIAIGRAEKEVGSVFPPASVFVIGDTPKDIACAEAAGAVSVAVATGAFDRETLSNLGADLTLDDLETGSDALINFLEP